MLTLSPRVRLGACAGAPGGSLRGEIRLLYRFSRVRLGAFAGTPRGDLIGEIRFLKPFPLVWFRCVCWRARREFTSWTLFWTTSTSPARHGSGKRNQVYIDRVKGYPIYLVPLGLTRVNPNLMQGYSVQI